MELPDREICYRALQSRDPRFDGLLFVGVTSTGIYCRPVCPARTAKYENVRFFASAAAAQEAGFRPCLRCRPQHAPRSTQSELIRRVCREIGEDVDRPADLRRLAAGAGISAQHLQRTFRQAMGK